MTDEDWTDEHERSLADLFGFDPADERADDVPDAVGSRVQALFTAAIGDEPAARVSPLAVVAAARRESEAAERAVRRDRERAGSAAGFERLRRRSTVVKGLLIAAAAALVVVAVPALLRGASSSDTASSVAGPTTAAAGELNSDAGSGSAGGGRAPAVSSEAASSGAATSAASSAAAASSNEAEVPGATNPAGTTAASASPVPTSTRALTEQDSAGSTGPKQPIGPGSAATATADSGSEGAAGSASSTTCVWPRLDAGAVVAALVALDLPNSTPVQQPVSAACAAGQVGAVRIPSAGVTVLVAKESALTSDPQYGYSTARATTTGDGISVLVLSRPAAGADHAEVTPAQRAAVARAVLAAVR